MKLIAEFNTTAQLEDFRKEKQMTKWGLRNDLNTARYRCVHSRLGCLYSWSVVQSRLRSRGRIQVYQSRVGHSHNEESELSAKFHCPKCPDVAESIAGLHRHMV